jgi:putative transposase
MDQFRGGGSLASGQINMRKVDGWQTLATKSIDQQFDLAA